MVKSLEDICLHFLMKNCDLKDFEEEKANQSLSCYVDVVLLNACENVYLLCQCPMWQYDGELINFWDWCLFHEDTVSCCSEFNDITRQSKFVRIVRYFDRFFKILSHWNSVNKKVVDDYFETMKTRDHYVCGKL